MLSSSLLLEPGIINSANIRVRAISNNSIELFWKFLTISEANGIVTAYYIRILQNGEIYKTMELIVSKNNTRTNETMGIGGFKPYTVYDFQIAAENDKGKGPYSETKSVRTKEGSK